MDGKVKLFGRAYLTTFVIVSVALITIFFISNVQAATPTAADSIISISNSSKASAAAGTELNFTGGNITKINITAQVQNIRWKAFIGNLTGGFTLDDSGGSTIYDWSLAAIAGRVYATRNETTVNWSGVVCATNTTMEAENNLLAHTNNDDNITKTFSLRDHPTFTVGAKTLTNNSCPTARPYVNNVSQSVSFNETVLYDGDQIFFSAELETDVKGYNNRSYDFQMIVPENASLTFTSNTAYYIYIELE